MGYHDQVMDACLKENHVRVPMLVIRGNNGLIFAAAPKAHLLNWDKHLVTEWYGLDYWYKDQAWRLVSFDHLLNHLSDRREVQRAG